MKNSQIIFSNTGFTKNLCSFVVPINKATENLDFFHNLEVH